MAAYNRSQTQPLPDDCRWGLKINGQTALHRRANKSSECVPRWRNRNQCECHFSPTSWSWELFFLAVWSWSAASLNRRYWPCRNGSAFHRPSKLRRMPTDRLQARRILPSSSESGQPAENWNDSCNKSGCLWWRLSTAHHIHGAVPAAVTGAAPFK